MEMKRVKESPIQKMMNAVERWMMRSLPQCAWAENGPLKHLKHLGS